MSHGLGSLGLSLIQVDRIACLVVSEGIWTKVVEVSEPTIPQVVMRPNASRVLSTCHLSPFTKKQRL